MESIRVGRGKVGGWTVRVLLLVLAACFSLEAGAAGKTYRIRGRRFTEEELRTQHGLIREKYVMQGGQVVPAGSVGAFPVSFKIDKVVEPMIVIGRAVGAVKPLARPDSAPGGAARTGKEFTIAETDADILADIAKGSPFAVRLEKPATEMPLSGNWQLMLVDSQTFLDRVKQGRIKGYDLGKLRVLYDVTIDFDGFVGLLQRGQVFREIEP